MQSGIPPLVFESNDAARVLEVSTARIGQLARMGALLPVAITRRGVKLFAPDDVAALAEARRQRKDGR